MARRPRLSATEMFRPVVRPVLCGAGLLGGLAAGGFVLYVSGLWNSLDRVLGMPLQELTINDLITAIAPFAVVFGYGWFGTRAGLRLAAKLEN